MGFVLLYRSVNRYFMDTIQSGIERIWLNYLTAHAKSINEGMVNM